MRKGKAKSGHDVSCPYKEKNEEHSQEWLCHRTNFETSSSAAEAGVIGVADMSELKLRPPKKGRVEIEIGKEKSGSKDPPLHGTTQCKKLEKAKRGPGGKK